MLRNNVDSVKQKWDAIYSALDAAEIARRLGEPALVLSQNEFLLPKQGRALDLACGLGGNAIFLAQKGYSVTAWDISKVAINHIQQHAAQAYVKIHACAVEIETALLLEHGFDIIVVQRFLARDLVSAIYSALNSGGLLFYQTYTQAKTSLHGPKNPDFLLAPGEIAIIFRLTAAVLL